MINKKRVAKFIRNVSISIVVIAVLLVGAGVAYTWFMGRNPSVTTDTEVVESKPAPSVQHTEVSPNTPESASIQSLTTPIIPGDNASVTIKTNPGSWCTITVVYDKTPSKDSGLMGKTADEFGSLTWTWTVESSAPVGKWPVTVTCLRNKLSAVVIGDLVVQKEIQN